MKKLSLFIVFLALHYFSFAQETVSIISLPQSVNSPTHFALKRVGEKINSAYYVGVNLTSFPNFESHC
jgi:hypothetical protein